MLIVHNKNDYKKEICAEKKDILQTNKGTMLIF